MNVFISFSYVDHSEYWQCSNLKKDKVTMLLTWLCKLALLGHKNNVMPPD